jgi:hypothetical protein
MQNEYFIELVHLYLKILRTDLHINLPQNIILRKISCIPPEIIKEILETSVKNSEKISIIKRIINSIVDINQVDKIELNSLREWLKNPPRKPIKRN